ncbi:hypothetical protein JD844_019443 [Phrynosoma platyrhinos]|uniref:ZNFX1 domain-containing protein n=1 Tax=Phrynosoma platyrhinos TaxID=52577 RepID=A0ABQ7SQ43_PHRPL|nr:hypothetical protein JD844_019443 [Phrynosoma platyrhinos]
MVDRPNSALLPAFAEQRQEQPPPPPPPPREFPGGGPFRPRGPFLRGPRLRHDEPKEEMRGTGPSGRILLPELHPRRPSSLQRGGGGGRGALGAGHPSPGRGARQGAPWNQGRPYQRIGGAFLEQLLQKEPSEVAITLACSPGLEEALSQTALRPPFLQLLCRALCRACSSHTDRHSIQRLLGLVRDSAFLRVCLPQYVAGMLTEAVPAVRHRYPQHVANIVALVQELASVFPASSIQSVAMLMSILPASVNALRASGVNFAEEAERELERVQAYVQHLQDRRREGTLRMDSQIWMGGAPEGEGDYRAMSIFPTYQELHREETPFLRPNSLAQPYESPGVYLETHFRLLREDFVRPMREGIVQLLQCTEQQRGMRQRRFDDIRVYFNARILAPACSAAGIEYKVRFDTKPLRSVRWENSKRLLYGSLVCLSKDGFETFLFATVAQRESRDLRKGIVHLSFVERSRPLLAEARPSDSFLMVETAAYFEAYHHVLRGLQELREEGLPFQRYIVHCEAEVAAPGYLRASGSTYDLRCLVGKLPATTGPDEEEEEDHKQGDVSAVNILNPQQWPGKAFLSSLAGKTYVGLKIVQALLANNAGWGKSPILVVCYTNHALDQFLEGILAFKEKGIVRVGGRSNSESLKQFTLRELRSRDQFRKRLPHHLRMAHSSVSSEMQEAQAQLTEEAAVLECGLRGILHERHLRSCIADHHWKSLAAGWVRKTSGRPL